MSGTRSTYVGEEKCIQGFGGKPERNRPRWIPRRRWENNIKMDIWEVPLGRPRLRWVDNIRMDLQEVGCGYMDWNGLAQDRNRWLTLVSAVMNLGVPWNGGSFLTSCKPVSFPRRTLHHGVRTARHKILFDYTKCVSLRFIKCVDFHEERSHSR